MKVMLFGTLRSVVGGNKEVEVLFDEGNTVQEVLTRVAAVYPDLREKILSDREQLSAGVLVFVNGRSIRFLSGLDTRLHQNDRLALFPPLAGG